MNEEKKTVDQEQAVRPAVASPSRRRLIRLGTAAVPVAATLASRPALAWHCRTFSAWGSIDLAKATGGTSLATRDDHLQNRPDECWYISDWVNNTQGSCSNKPWDAAFGTPANSSTTSSTTDNSTKKTTKVDVVQTGWIRTTTTTVTNKYGTQLSKDTVTYDTRNDKTCSQFTKGALKYPSGCSGSTALLSILTSGSDFQKAIIVAQLNMFLLPQLQASGCTNSTELGYMATKAGSNGYSPPGIKDHTWNASQVVTYLSENWLAR